MVPALRQLGATEVKLVAEHTTLPAVTTAEEDRADLSRRTINLLWEVTQALIAIGVTLSAMYAFINGIDNDNLENAAFVVLGFYFGRTNHSRPNVSTHRIQMKDPTLIG